MKINFIKPLAFQYKSELKTQWLKGNMPTVTKGLYGGTLTKKNVTLEHLVPHSQGGKTTIKNLALAVDKNNFKRGAQPLENFLTKEMLEQYLEQFKDIKLPEFDGNRYIKQIHKLLEGILNNES